MRRLRDDAIDQEVSALVLPALVTTRNGATFDARQDIWTYLDGVKSIYLDFNRLHFVAPTLLWSIKKTLIWFAENKAPGTLNAAFDSIKTLMSFIHAENGCVIHSISDSDLMNVRARFREIDGHDLFFQHGRPLLKRLCELGYPGVDRSAQKFLKEVKLKRPPAGTKVSLLDPDDGPYTDMERESLLDALSFGFAQGRMTTQQYLIAWFCALFGQRPKQYALLKLCDFVVEDVGGVQRYILRIPLTKGHDELERSRFEEFEIISELADLISQYKSTVLTEFTGLIEEPEQAPFFPSKSSRRMDNAPGLEYHMLAVTISDELRRAFKDLDVKSERTGELIRVNPYRFRYTVGTNSIREGLGLMGTAARLGHSTVKSVKPYVSLAMAYELHDRIEFSTAARLGSLAQSFKGVIAFKESDKRTTSPESHIVNPAIDPTMEKPMGDCDQLSFCGFNKPIACYTCPLFCAWLDGPHQLVYEYLIADRKRLKESGCSDKIVGINDRTLSAVAWVIMRCQEELGRRKSGELNK